MLEPGEEQQEEMKETTIDFLVITSSCIFLQPQEYFRMHQTSFIVHL